MYNSDPPSNPLHAWQQWVLRVEQCMQEQQQTIERLEQELQRIKQQLAMQEQASPIYHVEKIEYRFDQLKVDTLEGSLQIGLSTSNPEQLPMMIEDFMMQQQNSNSAPPFPYHSNGHKTSANPPYNGAASNAAPHIAKTNKKLKNRLHEEQSSPSPKASENAQAVSKDEEQTHQLNIEACIEQIRLSLQQRFSAYIDRQSSLLQLAVNEEHKTLIIEDLDRQLSARVHYYYEAQRNKQEHVTIDSLQQRVIKLTINDIESAIDQYLYRLTQENVEGLE